MAIAAAYALALGAGCSLIVDTTGLSGGAGDAGAPKDGAASADAPADATAPDGALLDGSAKTYRDAVLADDPLAYWRLGETGGTVAKDESGHGHDAAYRSGCTFGQKGALANDADTAVRFSSNTTCGVEIDDIDFSGTSPFTLEAWAQHDGVDGMFRHLFNKNEYPPAAGREQFGVYVESSNGLVVERWVNGASRSAGVTPPPAGQWFHMVATFDGTRLRLYVDGVERKSAPETRAQAAKTVPLVMGANGSSTPWNGMIDELAVYAKALDGAAIKRHYDAAK